MVDVESLVNGQGSGPKKHRVRPFLKWPGGKRWFVAQYSHLLPLNFERYIEPFLGAGSIFFYLLPAKAILGDLNQDLITAYEGVKDSPDKVVSILLAHQIKHSPEHYYHVRDGMLPESLAERAARIIYLNRTCFNGIYRVNRQGRFNVPIGTRTNVLLDTDDFGLTASLLANADLRWGDFESLVDEATQNDLVFLDPPYTVRHNNNGFIKYNEHLFSWQDQERLALAASHAVERGAHVVVTNAAHQTVRELYPADLFDFHEVSRFSSISATLANRRQYEELVIVGKQGREIV